MATVLAACSIAAFLLPTRSRERSASFYVGCTRAVEYLEVFAHRRGGLVDEMERALGLVPEPPQPSNPPA